MITIGKSFRILFMRNHNTKMYALYIDKITNLLSIANDTFGDLL